jgi:N-methylhydantoinase A
VYGYSDPTRPVEIVTIRVRARRTTAKPVLPPLERERIARPEKRRVWTAGRWRFVPVLRRAQVSATTKPGPALVLDYGTTTLVPPKWRCRTGRAGNLILEFK